MTNEEKKKIRQFEARVRQLILQYKTLQDENIRLGSIIEDKDDEIKTLKAQLNTCQTNYETLKTAKMMTISDGDIKITKQRITGLVREVNKCIALLTNEDLTIDSQEQPK